jgi:uncharacterized protein YndB with AHSA1/START domain
MTSLTPSLPYRVERTIVIHAAPDTVFRFFTDSARWAAWWGAGSTIDPHPGGRVFIRYPEGTEASGEVVDVAVPERLVFTYGFAKGNPIPPSSSRVTIRLASHASGTELRLVHELEQESLRNEFIQGWRYQLALFSNIVSDELLAGASDAIDRWFGAWAEPDADARARALEAIAVSGVRFRDRYSHTDGTTDLSPHIAAAQKFMPGLRLTRDGAVRQCQGVALADWVARGTDGDERARGTNVFVFGADGRIESVTGFWGR